MDQTYIHLVTSHLPIFGSLLGALVLIQGIWKKSNTTLIYFLLPCLLIILLAACKNNKNMHPEVSNHAEHATLVALNNGQKWNANVETTAGIKKMSGLLKSLPEQPTIENYKSLKTELDNEFDIILQKCTMTGEAHNQLHNYLMPLKEKMESLDSNSADEAQMASENIQRHLEEYYNYFQ